MMKILVLLALFAVAFGRKCNLAKSFEIDQCSKASCPASQKGDCKKYKNMCRNSHVKHSFAAVQCRPQRDGSCREGPPCDVTPEAPFSRVHDEASGSWLICCVGDEYGCCEGRNSCFLNGDPRHVCSYAPNLFFYNNFNANFTLWFDTDVSNADNFQYNDFEVVISGKTVHGNWSYKSGQ